MPMPTDRNVNYSLIYVLLAMVVICFLAIAGPLVIEPALNNLKKNMALREFETAFQDVQHAAGTERLALRTEAGSFADSERGCDFFVGQVRRYDGSQETILAAYAHQEVKGNPVHVLFIENGQIPVRMSRSLPEPLNDLAGWELPSGAEQQPLYMVYLSVVGDEGNMGLDCH
jgi:hypothetical protein